MQLVDVYPGLGELLARVDGRMERAWEGADGFLERAVRRALIGRGKRLRPGVLLLCAECAGGATESSVALAGVVEVVHAASLVHDDVVDEAVRRRGRRSANAMWGNNRCCWGTT
jgi:geranylgeranyl pyrophosphate synthase